MSEDIFQVSFSLRKIIFEDNLERIGEAAGQTTKKMESVRRFQILNKTNHLFT